VLAEPRKAAGADLASPLQGNGLCWRGFSFAGLAKGSLSPPLAANRLNQGFIFKKAVLKAVLKEVLKAVLKDILNSFGVCHRISQKQEQGHLL